jgi:hypothetical protein
MKKLLVAGSLMMLLGACYTKKLTFVRTPENYQVRVISLDSAEIYKKNYTEHPRYKAAFKEGMFIPLKIIEALKTDQGITGISIYYGQSPEFLSPVFIITGTKENVNYKIQKNESGKFATEAYLVYYPCPTHCGGR